MLDAKGHRTDRVPWLIYRPEFKANPLHLSKEKLFTEMHQTMSGNPKIKLLLQHRVTLHVLPCRMRIMSQWVWCRILKQFHKFLFAFPFLQSENADTPKTYETTTLLYVSAFMYLSVSVAFSHGKPFRTAIYKNKWFLASLLLLAGFTIFMMFSAPLEFNEFMEQWRIPDLDFLLLLCGIAAVHFIMSLFIEYFLIENTYIWSKIKSLCAKKTHRKQYKNIERYLQCSNPSYKNGSRRRRTHLADEIAIPALFDGQVVYSKIPIETYKSNAGLRCHLWQMISHLECWIFIYLPCLSHCWYFRQHSHHHYSDVCVCGTSVIGLETCTNCD